MDLENFNGEQPEVLNASAGAQQVSQEAIDKDLSNDNNDGSPYGKFKDAKSLLSAYNNLEAEFTRRSQRLKELEKGSLSKNGDASQETINETASENRDVPFYKTKEWKGEVTNFLAANPEAKNDIKAISKIILSNPSVASNKDCLNIAYKMAIAEKYVEPALLSQDESFLEKYILDNPRAKELIISNYINSLKNRPTAPTTIEGQPSALAKSPAQKLTSLDQAGEVLKKMFK